MLHLNILLYSLVMFLFCLLLNSKDLLPSSFLSFGINKVKDEDEALCSYVALFLVSPRNKKVKNNSILL
jgi:hypothetical protein